MNMSVIIPTYNRKSVLRHTILALVNQGVDSYEVIVCDDGSDDGTKETVERLSQDFDLPFDLLYQFQKRTEFRAGTARNMGVKIARGEKLVFIDQDVILQPKALARFDKIHDNHFLVGMKKLVKLEFYNKLTDDDILNGMSIFEKTTFGMIMATLSSFGIIFKKDFDKVGGFDEDFIGYGLEDSELMARLTDVKLIYGKMKDCYGYHIAHDYGQNIVSRRSQDTFHHKRNNSRHDGKKIPVID